MTVTALIFDLDNTLLSSDHADRMALERLTSFLRTNHPHLSVDEFETCLKAEALALFESYDFYDFTVMIGISPIEGLWGKFNDETLRFPELDRHIRLYREKVWLRTLAALGIFDRRMAKVLELMYIAIRIETVLVYEDTFEVLDQLYEAYPLLLLTNDAPALQQLKLRKVPKLRKYFKRIISSGDFGQGKPAPALFDFALSRLQADKQTTLMVGDDLLTDVLGANATGIRSVWLNRRNETLVAGINPDFIVHSLTDVLAIVEDENKR